MQPIKYTTCERIISKVYSDLEINSNLKEKTIINWIGEAMEFMDTTIMKQSKVVELEIDGYRALLPCDLAEVESCKRGNTTMHYDLTKGSSAYHNNTAVWNNKDKFQNPINTYTIQAPFLNVFFEKGFVTLYYKGFPVDENGIPLVPDNILFVEACYLYILYKLKTPQYHAGTLSFSEWRALYNTFARMSDKARADVSFPHPDKIESILNSWNRIITVVNDHKFGGYFSNF